MAPRRFQYWWVLRWCITGTKRNSTGFCLPIVFCLMQVVQMVGTPKKVTEIVNFFVRYLERRVSKIIIMMQKRVARLNNQDDTLEMGLGNLSKVSIV